MPASSGRGEDGGTETRQKSHDRCSDDLDVFIADLHAVKVLEDGTGGEAAHVTHQGRIAALACAQRR